MAGDACFKLIQQEQRSPSEMASSQRQLNPLLEPTYNPLKNLGNVQN